MKFGVNILNYGWVATPEHLRGWARFLEETGFHAALISDHIAVTPDVAEPYPAPFYDPFTTLSWFAGMTERIELGTTVTVLPYRNPLLTARVAANIDRFSDGRMILGVGVGWAEREYEALGLPFDKRGAITDEHLAAIHCLWGRDTASFDGEYVSFHDVSTGPRPVRSPHPPIWVGGASRAAIRRAVRYGTAWHPVFPTLDWLRSEGLPALRETAQREQRATPAFVPRIPVLLTDEPLEDEKRWPGEGTLDQIRSDLHAFAELGAEYVLLDTYRGTPDQLAEPEQDQRTLELLAEHVLDLRGQTLR